MPVARVRDDSSRLERGQQSLAASTDVPGAAVAGALLLGLGLLLSLLGMLQADWRDIGRLGLVEALPETYFAGLATVCVAAGLSLAGTSRAHHSLALACAAGLVLVLHAAPAIVEPVARFNVAWLHAGFSDHVASTGSTLPGLDARFSWPAFFALSAAVQDALHIESASRLLQGWPVVMNLLYLPAVYLLAVRLTSSTRAGLVAALVFPVLSWAGQDYYSPQSLAVLLLLAILLAALTWFPAHDDDRPPELGTALRLGRPSRSAVGQHRRPSGQHHRPTTGVHSRERAAVISRALVSGGAVPSTAGPAVPRGLAGLVPYLLILVMFGALTVEHQLTPVATGLMLAALVVTRRLSLTLLPLWTALVVLAWISFGATPYWEGHLDELFGNVGQVTGNLARGATERLGGSPEHALVVNARLALSLAVWIAGGVGVAMMRGWGRRASGALLLAPVMILAAQSYGGEGTIRIYLYTLPIACTGLGALVVRFRGAPEQGLVVAAVLVLVMPAFLLSRWGNEIFEQTRPDERRALEVLYETAPEGSTLAALSPQLSWRYTEVGDHRYRTSTREEFASSDLSGLRRTLGDNPRGTYLIITTGQLAFGEEVHGLPPDWTADTEAAMLATGEFDLVYENPDARVYSYDAIPAGQRS